MTRPHLRLGSVVVALASLVASAAGAADLPTTKGPPPAPAPYIPPAFTWTGFYIGGNVGGAFGDGSLKTETSVAGVPMFTNIIPNNFNNAATSVIGGGQVGYNYQFGLGVVGIESDFDWTGIDRSASVTLAGPGALSTTTFARTEVNWIGTTRGRLGYAFGYENRLLVFGTGGVAYGGVQNNGSITINGAPAGDAWSGSNSPTLVGWTAGGGLEYAITNNITIRGEYLFYDLGSQKTVFGPNSAAGIDFPATTFAAKANYDGSIARGAINWKFW